MTFIHLKTGKAKKIINLIPNSKYYYGDIVSKMNYSNYKERILHLYLYLLNSKESNVFAPIDKSQPSDKQYELYRPFHFIADYFKGMGYAGIVFKSTVNKSGKNIVIFDVNDVEGDISTRKKIDFL